MSRRNSRAAKRRDVFVLAAKPDRTLLAPRPAGSRSANRSTAFPGSKLEGIGAQHPFLPRTVDRPHRRFCHHGYRHRRVHIAPGHGEDDYSLGKASGLPILSPVDDHGRYTDEVGLPELVGKYVFDANADIVRLLRDRGMLVAEETYPHSYPYCWRSKTPIIFRAVEQFFIRIDDLRAARPRRDHEGKVASALGRKSHCRHGRVAA